MLLSADTLLTGRELLRPGWIDVADGTVHAIGSGAAPHHADADLGAVTVVPGFVDTHVHGGGGASFSMANPADASTAAALHLRHGTTTLVASLVTAGPAELARQVAELAHQVHAGGDTSVQRDAPDTSARARPGDRAAGGFPGDRRTHRRRRPRRPGPVPARHPQRGARRGAA